MQEERKLFLCKRVQTCVCSHRHVQKQIHTMSPTNKLISKDIL